MNCPLTISLVDELQLSSRQILSSDRKGIITIEKLVKMSLDIIINVDFHPKVVGDKKKSTAKVGEHDLRR